MTMLLAQPLEAESFRPFGEIIDLDDAEQVMINDGQTTRFHDLCSVDMADPDGRVGVSVFRSTPVVLPYSVQRMERHPLGSQAFVPLAPARFYVLVATGSQAGGIASQDLRLFVSNGQQGVNFFRNTWHHFQLALDQRSDFLVIDTIGPGLNLEELPLIDDATVPVPL